MKHFKQISLLLITTLGCFFASCEETTEWNEFANWQERNIAYIDSIAKVAEANANGEWLKILDMNLNENNIAGEPIKWENDKYVYCNIIKKGTGTQHPTFTDGVEGNYRGRLIPSASYQKGYVFDQSYRNDLDPAKNTPVPFTVDGVIVGWSTALQQMVEGDVWRIYIPANLAYDKKGTTSIPAHSALIFDINLVKITH